MKITREDLLAAGFKPLPHGTTITLARHADAGFQKRCRDAAGDTLFFIEALEYSSDCPLSRNVYTFSARLYKREVGMPGMASGGFNLELPFTENTVVEQVEDFYLRAYHLLGCCPDPHN